MPTRRLWSFHSNTILLFLEQIEEMTIPVLKKLLDEFRAWMQFPRLANQLAIEFLERL
jgi:hypothetical protein